jgi:hypothetical protein
MAATSKPLSRDAHTTSAGKTAMAYERNERTERVGLSDGLPSRGLRPALLMRNHWKTPSLSRPVLDGSLSAAALLQPPAVHQVCTSRAPPLRAVQHEVRRV